MKYGFINDNRKRWPITLMCSVLGVVRSGFYAHINRKADQGKAEKHAAMLAAVVEVAKATHNAYGTRRMRLALADRGLPVSRYKVRKLMREAAIQVKFKRRFRNSNRKPNPNAEVFPNVVDRNFNPAQRDLVYVGDITYIDTRDGFLYLAVYIDLYSRRVVGWAMGARMTAGLVCDALRLAVLDRRPAPGLVVHSDRGAQYTSGMYQQLLKQYGFVGSMSRVAECWDNAVAESFFGSLKTECVMWKQYKTREEAQQSILAYITMFYNSTRLHSTLGYKSPNSFEGSTDE